MAALGGRRRRGPTGRGSFSPLPHLAWSSGRPVSLGWGWGGAARVRGWWRNSAPHTHTLLRPLGGDAHALGVCGEHPLTTAV